MEARSDRANRDLTTGLTSEAGRSNFPSAEYTFIRVSAKFPAELNLKVDLFSPKRLTEHLPYFLTNIPSPTGSNLQSRSSLFVRRTIIALQ